MREVLGEAAMRAAMAAVRAHRRRVAFTCEWCRQKTRGYVGARFCSPQCRVKAWRAHKRVAPGAPADG